jgi:hypothetical protein
MAEFTPISLGTRSNLGRFGGPDGGSRLINCYAEAMGAEGEITWPIYPIDGQVDYATFDAGTVRAQLVLDDRRTMLTVCGSLLYQEVKSLSGTSTQTTIGGILGDGLVTTARNRNANPMAAIVTGGAGGVGGNYYIWQNGVLTEPLDTDLPAPNSVAWVDGFFVFGIPDGRFFISNIDESTIDALDFASAEANPDGIKRVTVRNRDLVIFGARSTEFWRNTGASDFPFERITAVTNQGLLAAGSVALLQENLVYGASDGTVKMLQGYSGARISDHSVERAIADEADPSAVTAYAYERRGHSFYVLSGESFTYAYDATTQRWHERKSYNAETWRCSTYAEFDGEDIFGSATEAKLYKSHQDYHDESGNPLVMTMQPPTLHAGDRFILDALSLKFVAGQGLNTPSAPATLTPEAMLRISRDGGITFGPERRIALGVQGQRVLRGIERRFGRFVDQGATVQISCSAAVARGFLGLGVKARGLAA